MSDWFLLLPTNCSLHLVQQCASGRGGTLCGSCSEGYLLSFFSDRCVLKTIGRCDTVHLAVYFVFMSAMYTIVFAFLQHIIGCVVRRFSARGATSEDKTDDEIEMSNAIVTKESSHSNEMQPFPFPAFITLICFFVQVASLVHVDVLLLPYAADKDAAENTFLESVFKFFNFRVDLYCAVEGLNLQKKESVNMALKLCSIFNLLVFFLIWKIVERSISLSSSCASPSSIPKKDSCNNQENDNELSLGDTDRTILSFPTITKLGFIKLVKLNFTSISAYTFTMINCVSINGELRLYNFGDMICYHWWQKVILGAVLPTVVLFPLSFGISLSMLKGRYISSTTFLYSSVMPLVSVVLFMKKMIFGMEICNLSEEEENCIKEILQAEEELFKECNSVPWVVIQLYRNMVVALVNTFILNPVYKSIIMSPLFHLFGIHDARRMPYKHVFLNYLQIFTSSCLLIINACNVLPSLSIVFNLMVVPAISDILRAAKFVEMLTLISVPLTLPLWMIWEKIKGKREEKNE